MNSLEFSNPKDVALIIISLVLVAIIFYLTGLDDGKNQNNQK